MAARLKLPTGWMAAPASVWNFRYPGPPQGPREMPLEMTSPTASASGTRGNVLVVDDEADIREGLEMLLTSEGYAVDLAQNGAEGLHRMENRGYDLVLLDLMMPDLSGLDVITEVRKRDRETPIFLITAYGSVEAG